MPPVLVAPVGAASLDVPASSAPQASQCSKGRGGGLVGWVTLMLVDIG